MESSPSKVIAKQTRKIIDVVFCWWTLCDKEQRSTQMSTALLYESSKNIAKQTAWHAVKGCSAPSRLRNVPHFLNDLGLNRRTVQLHEGFGDGPRNF
ncbi:hypothetical protein TNCV_2642351 [Trichonephila clavipes]|nr:hypothetical protein TNCV_2642351 [Trichonephila clavipes]